MAGQVELIADGTDIALVGDQSAVDRFLTHAGLLDSSVAIPLGRLRSVLSLGADSMSTVAEVIEKSGRYLKLTPESAEALKAAGGPMKTKDGTTYAMLGDPGKVARWLQIEDGPGALLTNPAVLTGLGGLMTQLAQQAEANELRALIARIDDKLDDVRRAQRDVVLAKLDRAIGAIDEAMIIRDTGGDPETLWGKVQAESGTILEVQGAAMRALDALADKIEGKHKAGDLRKATVEIEREVGVWLAVLARCFALQDEFKVLEIDHVVAKAPEKLEGHRRGVAEAIRTRRSLVLKRTTALMDRMDVAGGIASQRVLLHARSASATIESLNSTAALVDDFHTPLGIEMRRDDLVSPRWRTALRDPKLLKVAGVEAAQKAAVAGGTAFAAVATLAAAKSINKGDS